VHEDVQMPHHLSDDHVGTRSPEADEHPLNHVDAIRIATKAVQMFQERRHHQPLLIYCAYMTDQGLQRMGPTLVDGNAVQVVGSYFKHPLALPDGTSLEGCATHMVSVSVTHQGWKLRLYPVQDVLDDARMGFEQLLLQHFAARWRARQLHHSGLRKMKRIALPSPI